MDRLQEYRRNAEEAERLARKGATAHERDSYERIAQGWRDLLAAEQSTRQRRPPEPPAIDQGDDRASSNA